MNGMKMSVSLFYFYRLCMGVCLLFFANDDEPLYYLRSFLIRWVEGD
jgi:hypothetical protein